MKESVPILDHNTPTSLCDGTFVKDPRQALSKVRLGKDKYSSTIQTSIVGGFRGRDRNCSAVDFLL